MLTASLEACNFFKRPYLNLLVKVIKAYKFRLKTNKNLDHMLWIFAGQCRQVWNYFFFINDERLKRGVPILRYHDMSKWLTLLKKTEEYSYLKEAPSQALQQKLKDLDKAYKNGFDKTQPNKRLPKPRKKRLHSSFRIPSIETFQLENNRIKLPKLGRVNCFKSRVIEGIPRNYTISHQSGHWYVSIQTEKESAIPDHKGVSVGIDLGIKIFAALSSNKIDKVVLPLNSFKRLEDQLVKAQRKLSGKKKFSANWKKQNIKLSIIHTKIANARNDYLHKLSTEISNNHAMIFMEDLKVKNMSKSAKGTIEVPGTNVKAKSGLNQSILDQGWGIFRRFLEYKSTYKGGLVNVIDPRNTSRTCSECGSIHKESRKSQEEFRCIQCGFPLNADINAARNILAAGLSRFGLSSESLKRSAAETCGTAQANATPVSKQEISLL